jgi:hypothetical protein
MMNRKADMNLWISMIKAEYREMPGLGLTKPQVRRMWGLGESDCELVLGALEATDFLRVTARGCYVLADSERSHTVGAAAGT